MFHDLGLGEAAPDERPPLRGRRSRGGRGPSCRAQGADEDAVRRVWTAIALHTTPGIPEFMEPEVALVTAGVEYDVLGIGYDDPTAVTSEDRAAIVAAHPRPDFKRRILEAFAEGIAPRPDTTFGNVKADVLRHYVPGFTPGDFVTVIRESSWPE
ncbi:metal-dependent phosphohydrolase [Streptomyces narbonensis]